MTAADQAWAEPALEIDEQAERGVLIANQEIRVLAGRTPWPCAATRPPVTRARSRAPSCPTSRSAAWPTPTGSAASAGPGSRGRRPGPVQLTLRALVTARGMAGRIPLIGRQSVTIPLATSA